MGPNCYPRILTSLWDDLRWSPYRHSAHTELTIPGTKPSWLPTLTCLGESKSCFVFILFRRSNCIKPGPQHKWQFLEEVWHKMTHQGKGGGYICSKVNRTKHFYYHFKQKSSRIFLFLSMLVNIFFWSWNYPVVLFQLNEHMLSNGKELLIILNLIPTLVHVSFL